MLLSDDRNLPMPLQKTQISTISFEHSVGTGRTGVRPAPDVPRGCPPHSFLRQEGPANPSAATFLSQQSFGYCPRAKRSRSNTHAGVVGYLFETAHNAIAPMWQPRAYIRSCELSGVVESAHSNIARKTKGCRHKLNSADSLSAASSAPCHWAPERPSVGHRTKRVNPHGAVGFLEVAQNEFA
jgi:hypothetical protein